MAVKKKKKKSDLLKEEERVILVNTKFPDPKNKGDSFLHIKFLLKPKAEEY